MSLNFFVTLLQYALLKHIKIQIYFADYFEKTKIYTKTKEYMEEMWSTVESQIIEPPRKMKIGSQNQEFKISGINLQRNKSKGNDFWFELHVYVVGCLRN